VGDVADNVHATAIALGTHAALIRGAPGSGKSDLALRCLALAPTALIAGPVTLVADDRVDLVTDAGRLYAQAPATIRGKLEVRGLGIVTVPHVPRAEVKIVADLSDPQDIERLPDSSASAELAGVRVPLIRLAPFEAAAPVKLLLAIVQTIKEA
jgi:HPr kinase/phosphorylase